VRRLRCVNHKLTVSVKNSHKRPCVETRQAIHAESRPPSPLTQCLQQWKLQRPNTQVERHPNTTPLSTCVIGHH